VRVAGLFAGVGGFELGLERAGHETELLCEIDPAANAVLAARFPKVRAHVEDVTKLERLPRGIELVVAGFPCLDLSLAGGKVGIDGVNSSLVHHVFRLLECGRVPNVVIENVPFMLHLNGGEGLRVVLRELERLRYRWAARVVDALGFGVPQRRERVFVVASRELDPRRVLLADDRAAPTPPRSSRASFGFYWTEGVRGLGWAREAVPTLKGGSTIGIPSPPAIWIRGRGAFTPDLRDAERMQGFEPDWTKPAESRARASHRWKLVGNAVCARVSEWIGRRLAKPGEYDDSRDTPVERGRTLPKASWSDGPRRGATTSAWSSSPVSTFAASASRPPLVEWLRFEPRPLSLKATSGFLERAARSTLRFEPRFLDELRRHARRVGERAAAAASLLLLLWFVAIGRSANAQTPAPAASSIEWTALVPTKATATGGATTTIESDGTVDVGGAVGDKESITLEALLDRKGVTGFRLEALCDPSGAGPGWAPNGNFVLCEFKVHAAPKNSDAMRSVQLDHPTADHEQPGFSIVNAVDGAMQSGWAIDPQFGRPHVALFETHSDVGVDGGAKLAVTLDFQFGGKHVMRRFRVSTTTAPRPIALPRDLAPVNEAQGKVPAAIAHGVNFLLDQQALDGSWSASQDGYRHGMTALACYALLKCGVKKTHPAVQRAVDFMLCAPAGKTYEAGLELLALTALDEDEKYGHRIQETVERLLSWQGGGWSYPYTQPDLSNTQYAALGLRAAALHGAKVPQEAWLKLGDEVLLHEEKAAGAYEPAGFGYYKGTAATGSLTAAGVAVMHICSEQLEKQAVARATFTAAEKKGIAWLERHFAVDSNPLGDGNWKWYWLYGIERVGGLCKLEELGGRSWYREGTREIVEHQGGDGSWDGGGGKQPSTAFALLFLARATSSVSGVATRPADLYGGDDPKLDVSLRAKGDTPLEVWISSFGEAALAKFERPDEKGKGPHVSQVDYVLPGRALLADARADGGKWRCSFEPPTGEWTQPSFDDSKWRVAPGAFGQLAMAGTAVRTEWTSDDVWLRREFALDGTPTVDPRLFVQRSSAPPPATARPSLVTLFDEESGFASLFGESSGGAKVRVQDKDAFNGKLCLAVTPQQVYRAAMPGWSFAITEKPAAGEFRYLRLAWRKEGGNGVMVQFARDGAWGGTTRRVHAGLNDLKWPSTKVSDELPRKWTVVTVDLWKEFGGNGTLTGIALVPINGTAAYFDALYLARTLDDLKSIPHSEAELAAMAAKAARPSAPSISSDAGRDATPSSSSRALEVFLNGTPLFASDEEFHESTPVATLAPLKSLLADGRNVIAVHARRTGVGQSVDVSIADERVLATVNGDAAAPCGVERYPARVIFDRCGTWSIRARVHVRPPGVAAGATPIDELLTSAALTVPIREAVDPELLSYASDPSRNLIAQVGANAAASSSFDGNWLPKKAVDGLTSSGWLSTDADARPSLTIQLDKPVRADTILVSPLDMRFFPDPERHFRVRRVEVQVDQGKGGVFEITMPEDFRKGVARLPKPIVMRRLDVRILDASEVHPSKAALGLGEVELQLSRR
jgi:DNA (cytosine-5)-methyltransferase 1